MMTKTLDDMKMVHEEEMQNYDRMQETVTRVMHRHGCKIIQMLKFGYLSTVFREFFEKSTHGKYFTQSGGKCWGFYGGM